MSLRPFDRWPRHYREVIHQEPHLMWDTNDYTHSVLHRINSRDLQQQALQHRQVARSLNSSSRKISLYLTRLYTWLSVLKGNFNRVLADTSSPACQSTSCLPCCVAEA